jgi:sugar phosphate permease
MAANHISREGWYQIKPLVADDLGFSTTVLGAFDTTFLFFYSAGLYICGNIEDKLAMRLVMPLGMFGAALMIFLMALMGFIG